MGQSWGERIGTPSARRPRTASPREAILPVELHLPSKRGRAHAASARGQQIAVGGKPGPRSGPAHLPPPRQSSDGPHHGRALRAALTHGPCRERARTEQASALSNLGRRLIASLPGLLLAAAIALPPLFASGPVRAQSGVRPRITVAANISGEAPGQSALAIVVAPLQALPPGSFIRLRGLPPTVALSEGHSIAPGAWAVALRLLANLKVLLPAGLSGRTEIAITLVTPEGIVLAAATTLLSVVPAQAPGEANQAGPIASMLRARAAPAASPKSTQVPGGQSPSTRPSTPDSEPLEQLMKKGDQELEEGNVPSARLFYERAADKGLAQAAMALAATFDAAELAKRRVPGIAPDAKEAQRWYETARRLGAAEAEQRLKRLQAQ